MTPEERAASVVHAFYDAPVEDDSLLMTIADAIRAAVQAEREATVERVCKLFREMSNQHSSDFGLVQAIWADVVAAIRSRTAQDEGEGRQ